MMVPWYYLIPAMILACLFGFLVCALCAAASARDHFPEDVIRRIELDKEGS